MGKPAHCSDCPLYSQPVCGAEGDPLHAKIVYLAQNPGVEEGKYGRPLIGPSGRIFNRQLFEAGISREELYISNVVKCVTPNNRPPTDVEVRKCKHFLDLELKKCKADTVVLAGQVAYQALLGGYSTLVSASTGKRWVPKNKRGQPISFMERIGCVEQRDGRKWIATIHPAFVMRMPMFRHTAIEHLKKAWRISGLHIPLPKVERITQASKLEEKKEQARLAGCFADDVETDLNYSLDVDEDDYIGGDYKMTMCGFSTHPYESFIVEPSLIHNWADVFSDPTLMQFECNGEYDRYYLEQIAPQLNDRVDIQLGHHYLHNNVRKALKPHIVNIYTNLPYYNRTLDHFDSDLYCGMDNIATLLAGREIVRQLKDLGMWDVFKRVGMRMLPIMEMWRRKGMRVDLREALKMQKVTRLKVAQCEELITKMLGPLFSWNSPKQVASLYYDTWGLPKQYNKVRDKDGSERQAITVNDDARDRLRRWINADPERQKKHKAAKVYFDIVEAASENKKLSEYFDRISPDGRVHAHWTCYAETYRLKSKPNVQNWPTWPILTHKSPEGKRVIDLASPRSIVVPDNDEDLFLSADMSQFQLWIYAVQFGIKNLLDIYESGDYLYGAVYERVWKKPFFRAGGRSKKYKGEWITEQELLRAKAVPLGFLFDRSGESVAVEMGWKPYDGVQLKRDWMLLNPELAAAHASIKYEMGQKGRLMPPPGVLCHYPSPSLQGLNCFAQTPEVFIMKENCIIMEDEFKRRGYKNTRTVLTVHDSVLVNVGGAKERPENMVEVYEEVIAPTLNRSVEWLKGFRFRHEAKVGDKWDWGCEDYSKWKEMTCGDPVNC